MKKWHFNHVAILLFGLLAGFFLGRLSSRPIDSALLLCGNENALPPRAPDILLESGNDHGNPETAEPSSLHVAPSAATDRHALLSNAAKDFPDVVKRLSLRLFDENLNPVMSDWELLGVEPSQVSTITEQLKAPLDLLHDIEASDYKIITNDGSSVSLLLPPLSAQDSEKIKQEIETAFGSALPKELAAVLSSSFVSSNYSATGALTGRTRILSIEPRKNKENPQLIDAFRFTTRVILPGNESYVTNGENTPVETLDRITDYTVWLISKKIPRQWEHILSQSE